MLNKVGGALYGHRQNTIAARAVLKDRTHDRQGEMPMATRQNTQYNTRRREVSRNPYVYGNLAHQLEAVPQRRRQPNRQPNQRRQPKQRPVAVPVLSGAAFMFLMMAAVAVLVTCFVYLHVQSNLTQMKNEVISLQTSNAEMKLENKETYANIVASVDLSEVYQIATGQLGMIQAVDNQVFTYDNKKSDMVKQYGDIPKASR